MRKTGGAGATGGARARKEDAMMVDPDKYMEKPRPNLFTIVKKLKENNKAYRRICYVGKVSEG